MKKGRKSRVAASIFERDKAPSTDGEWFEYTIAVKGDTITLKVNGETTVQYKQEAGGPDSNFANRKLSEGTFALQAHDPGSEVHYRNIRVKVLIKLPERRLVRQANKTLVFDQIP